jgi:hypothetical protein
VIASRPKSTFSTSVIGKGRKFGERWDYNNVLPRQEIVLANLEETGSVWTIFKRMLLNIIIQDINLCLNFATIPCINESNRVGHTKPSLVNGRTRKKQARHWIIGRIYRRNTNSK